MYAIEISVDECIACDKDATNPAHVAAFVYARYPSGVTAAFCGSHGTMLLPSLIEQGATIIDMRHLIHA